MILTYEMMTVVELGFFLDRLQNILANFGNTNITINVSKKRVLIIVATPDEVQNSIEAFTMKITKEFAETCRELDCNVEIIDLYKDKFDPIWYPQKKETKVTEYQLRIKRADYIVFIHPVWWGSMPALMKGFLDKTLLPGFAFKKENGLVKGTLSSKKSMVICVSSESAIVQKYIIGSSISKYWQRVVLDKVGMTSRIHILGNIRSNSQKINSKYIAKVKIFAKRLLLPESIFELF